MVKFFKTYIPMILSILFLGMYSFVLSAMVIGLDYFANGSLILFLFLVIIGCFFIEWLYFMIQAATSKTLDEKALWVILIYLFNIFIIPYYNFKHVAKIKKIKQNMIIYIALSLLAIILGILIPTTIMMPY